MITLVNGAVQSPNGHFQPNGSISFTLNIDTTVADSEGGQVAGGVPIVFQFDETGNLVQPVQIWSNAELNPQNGQGGYGTFYSVTIFDANGARLTEPMLWQFVNPTGSTVNISQMTAYAMN